MSHSIWLHFPFNSHPFKEYGIPAAKTKKLSEGSRTSVDTPKKATVLVVDVAYAEGGNASANQDTGRLWVSQPLVTA